MVSFIKFFEFKCRNGICTPSGATYKCTCSPSFTGPTCAEQDPCQPNPVSLF
jgi:hypothetical protein